MNVDRKQMESELKKHCVPFLKERGFKGSFQNMYREIDGFVSLVNFQFFRPEEASALTYRLLTQAEIMCILKKKQK